MFVNDCQMRSSRGKTIFKKARNDRIHTHFTRLSFVSGAHKLAQSLLIYRFRAESLLKNCNRLQQQRDLAPFYGKDIGMGIGRRPLDLLNGDNN